MWKWYNDYSKESFEANFTPALLKKLNIRKFILAFDGDEAGRKAERKFRKALSNDKLVRAYHLPEGKDINDLNKEEFLNLEEF